MGLEASKNSYNQSIQKLYQLNNNRSCKTNFYYIHPLKCEPQDLEPKAQQFGQIAKKKHQQEYQIIQNNIEQPVNPSFHKDLVNIESIKVKWNQFIKMKKKNYLEDYSVLKQIGRGGFGCVHKVKGRYTGIYRAAKRIFKNQLKKSQHEKLFEQMAIMISLDHPNIAKLYQVYDYKSHYVLILQLCQGGQLFKKIVTKQLNQQLSAKIMKQILRTLIYLHSRQIVHRDLKPQNMLFQQNSDLIKIIDFGIAVKKKPAQILTSRLGTPYYIAPQVLCKNYGEKCDIWSAGVILYMMIVGYPPFRGQTQFQIMQNVLKQNVSFKGPNWNKVTSECKNLIGLMLKRNPDQRPSAKQAFDHPWIKNVKQKISSRKQENVLSNIRGFSFQNKLQAVVYTYIVSQLLTSQQKNIFLQIFKQLDKNNDGVIQSSQLRFALKQIKDVSEQRVNFLMRIIDTNDSGLIDYTQFLVAGIDPKHSLTQQHFQQAFQYFDMDHSGQITFEEIAHFLQDSKQSNQSIKKIFMQVDQNNDGTISKQQFVKLLFEQTKKKLQSFSSMHSNVKQQQRKRSNNKQNKKPYVPQKKIQNNNINTLQKKSALKKPSEHNQREKKRSPNQKKINKSLKKIVKI